MLVLTDCNCPLYSCKNLVLRNFGAEHDFLALSLRQFCGFWTPFLKVKLLFILSRLVLSL